MEDDDNRLEREIQHYCLFYSKSLYTDCVQGRQRVCEFTQRPRDGDITVGNDTDAHRKHHDPAVRPVLHALGFLKDSTGKALANKPIDIWVRHAGENGPLWKTMNRSTGIQHHRLFDASGLPTDGVQGRRLVCDIDE